MNEYQIPAIRAIALRINPKVIPYKERTAPSKERNVKKQRKKKISTAAGIPNVNKAYFRNVFASL